MTKFGGGRSTGFAVIYDNVDSRKKFDSYHHLVKDGIVEKRERNRKVKKELKTRLKKAWGTEKNKIKQAK